MENPRENVSREELYKQVWAEPIAKLATSYEVSGSYLARICRELNIPTPGRGYWAQLKAGQKLKRLALPPLMPGDPTIWIRSNSSAIHTDVSPVPPAARTELPPHRRSRAPYEILTYSQEIFSKAKTSYSSSIHLSPRHRKLVDLLTSQDNLEKSIALAQKLFFRLEDYGYRVVLANGEGDFSMPRLETEELPEKARNDSYGNYLWRPNPCTVAYLGTVAVGLTIVEMTEMAKTTTSWGYMTKVASGRYRIYAYSPYRNTQLVKSWQDTRDSALTSRFDEIIGEMEAMARQIPGLIAEGDKRAADERAKWEAEQREYQRKMSLEARQKAKVDSLASLKDLIAKWATWRSQQDFLDELDRAIAGLDPEAREKLYERTKAARSLLGTTTVADLIRTWKTPEDFFASLPSWARFEDP